MDTGDDEGGDAQDPQGSPAGVPEAPEVAAYRAMLPPDSAIDPHGLAAPYPSVSALREMDYDSHAYATAPPAVVWKPYTPFTDDDELPDADDNAYS